MLHSIMQLCMMCVFHDSQEVSYDTHDNNNNFQTKKLKFQSAIAGSPSSTPSKAVKRTIMCHTRFSCGMPSIIMPTVNPLSTWNLLIKSLSTPITEAGCMNVVRTMHLSLSILKSATEPMLTSLSKNMGLNDHGTARQS